MNEYEEKLQLLEQIKQQAQLECEKIKAAGVQACRQAEQAAGKQVQSLQAQHTSRLDRELMEIQNKAEQAKHRILREQEHLYAQMLFDRVQQRLREILREHAQTEEYRRTLIEWCAAGIRVLGESEVRIEASPEALELLDPQSLDEISRLVTTAGFAAPVISIDHEAAVEQEGVRIYSMDRRVLYSSLMEDHVQRSAPVIRRLVHDYIAEKEEPDQ